MPITIKPEIFNIGLFLSNKEINDVFDDSSRKDSTVDDTYALIETLNLIKVIGFDFIFVPVLLNCIESKEKESEVDHFRYRFLKHYEIRECEWNTGVIGSIPSNIILTISKLNDIFEWCIYVGFHAILIPIKHISVEFASEMLYFAGKNISGTQIWVELPLNKSNINEQWENWQQIQNILCNGLSVNKFGVVLTIDDDLDESDLTKLNRFIGEPIKCIIVNYGAMQTTNPEYFQNNTLAKFIEYLLRVKIPIAVRFSNLPNNSYRNLYLDTYRIMCDFLTQLTPLTQQEMYEYNYIDILQIPLQPLFDDLQNIYYETFEDDPIKYDRYTAAIKQCLSENIKNFDVVKMLIVGAGRGALVDCSITALKSLAIDLFEIVCVEKNRNAVITLEARKNLEKDEYWKKVEIIQSDIRDCILEHKFNIIISELLGSFGDNELAPECLYSAQKFLEPGGIMIPQSYTSFIEPVSCKKIWNSIFKIRRTYPMETPYVSKIKSCFLISNEGPKEIFKFNHPEAKIPIADEASLYCSVDFTSKTDSILHGFIGYFKCNLYKEIGFTTNRNYFTNGLISWFEFYFPINTSIKLKENDKISFNIWRKSNKDKVWYEWLVTNPFGIHIHNSNGRGYHMNL